MVETWTKVNSSCLNRFICKSDEKYKTTIAPSTQTRVFDLDTKNYPTCRLRGCVVRKSTRWTWLVPWKHDSKVANHDRFSTRLNDAPCAPLRPFMHVHLDTRGGVQLNVRLQQSAAQSTKSIACPTELHRSITQPSYPHASHLPSNTMEPNSSGEHSMPIPSASVHGLTEQ